MKGKALIWMCNNCKWITVSDQSPHRMDFCKCWEDSKYNKGCAVDFEQWYTRISGNSYRAIATVDLDTGKVTQHRQKRQTKCKKKTQ